MDQANALSTAKLVVAIGAVMLTPSLGAMLNKKGDEGRPWWLLILIAVMGAAIVIFGAWLGLHQLAGREFWSNLGWGALWAVAGGAAGVAHVFIVRSVRRRAREQHETSPAVDARIIRSSEQLFKERSVEWILENARPTPRTDSMPDVVVICKVGTTWSNAFGVNRSPTVGGILERNNIMVGVLFCRPQKEMQKSMLFLTSDPATNSRVENEARLSYQRLAGFLNHSNSRNRLTVKELDACVLDSVCAYTLSTGAVIAMDINRGWQQHPFPVLQVNQAEQKELYEALIARVKYLWKSGTTVDPASLQGNQ